MQIALFLPNNNQIFFDLLKVIYSFSFRTIVIYSNLNSVVRMGTRLDSFGEIKTIATRFDSRFEGSDLRCAFICAYTVGSF